MALVATDDDGNVIPFQTQHRILEAMQAGIRVDLTVPELVGSGISPGVLLATAGRYELGFLRDLQPIGLRPPAPVTDYEARQAMKEAVYALLKQDMGASLLALWDSRLNLTFKQLASYAMANGDWVFHDDVFDRPTPPYNVPLGAPSPVEEPTDGTPGREHSSPVIVEARDSEGQLIAFVTQHLILETMQAGLEVALPVEITPAQLRETAGAYHLPTLALQRPAGSLPPAKFQNYEARQFLKETAIARLKDNWLASLADLWTTNPPVSAGGVDFKQLASYAMSLGEWEIHDNLLSRADLPAGVAPDEDIVLEDSKLHKEQTTASMLPAVALGLAALFLWSG